MDSVVRFQELRNDVASITDPNEGARKALRCYLEQLDSAAEKFPVSETSVKVAFTWNDTLRPNVNVSQYSWSYERACVLYNMVRVPLCLDVRSITRLMPVAVQAAIDTQIAVRMDRSTPEAIEAVRNLMSSAAGLLTHVRDAYTSRMVGSLPLDLTVDGLTLYISVLLAQAQSIYYELARAKNMKAETNSKLAGGAADMYRAAGKVIPTNPTVAGAVAGASLMTLREQIDESFPWVAHCELWTAVFDAASFFQYSEKTLADAESSGSGYGVRLAWLAAAEAAAQAAINVKVRAAAQPAKGKPTKSQAAAIAAAGTNLDTGPAEGLLRMVREKKAEAERDNKSVYMESVPRFADLPELPRAVLAKPLPYTEPPQAERPLFAMIVPAEVSKSLADLDDRLQALATVAKERASKATEAARATLSSIGLPGAVAVGAGSEAPGLPLQLWERVFACQRAGGLGELERQLASNGSVCTMVREALRQAAQVLDDEAARDTSYRQQFGARWTSLPSAVVASDVRADHAKYMQLLDLAIGSEEGVRVKLTAHRAALAGLSRSKSELDATIPGGPPGAGETAADPLAETLRLELLTLCSQIDKVLQDRVSLPSLISSKFDRTAAAQALMAAPQESHGDILERLMSAPNPALHALEESYQQQEALLSSVHAAHGRYGQVRRLDERTRAREAALQIISESVDRFDEIKSNLKEGEGFWAELQRRADSVLTRAKDMASARAMQQQELLMNLKAASEGSAAAAPGAGYPGMGGPSDVYGQASPMSHTNSGGYGGGGGGAVAVSLSRSGSSGYNPFVHDTGAVPVAQPTPAGFAPSPQYSPPTAVPVYHPSQPTQQHSAGAMGWGYPAQGSQPQGWPQQQPQSMPSAFPANSPALQQLTGMGFDRLKAERALMAAGGNFDAALNMLLTNSV